MTITPTAILFVPGITAEKAKQSAWLVPLLASSAGFASLWVSWKIGKRFPGYSLPQYSTLIFGKIIGKILGSGYILFFLVMNILVVREYTDFLKIALMPNTPIWALNLSIILVGSYGAFSGIEVLARSAQFVLPLFLLSLITLLGISIQDLNLEELLPLLEGGISPLIQASITPASWFGESIILVLLLPLINKPAEIKRKGFLALMGVAGLLCVETLITTAVLGPDLTGYFLFPYWRLARYLELGRAFVRVETLLVVLWISGIVMKVSIIHYITCLTTAQVFGLKSYQKVVLYESLILAGASTFLFSSTSQLNEILGKVWPPFAFIFELILPFFILSIAIVWKKRERKTP